MANQNISTKGKVRVGRYPLLRKLLLGFIVISLLNLAISHFFYTPKLYAIDNENREFVLKPLMELCPHFVHPLLNKRICMIYEELKNRLNGSL